MNPLTFAPAGPDVAPALCRWFPTPHEVLMWTGERFGPALDTERLAGHIARLNDTPGARAVAVRSATGDLVGYGELGDATGPRPRLSRIGVAPEARSHGVGRALVDHLVTHAFDVLGATAVELTVFTSNEPAVRLYRRIGFATDEVHRGARTGPDGTLHDVLIMTLDRCTPGPATAAGPGRSAPPPGPPQRG